MKVSRAQAEANREEIIEQASKLFRERGFSGVGLNELMQAAGLTRGGFYGQFESKHELMKLALARALEVRLQYWENLLVGADVPSLHILIRRYLGDGHRNQRALGCAMAALAGDACREDEEIREILGTGAKEMAGMIETMISADTDELRRQHAWACLAGLLGALVLSRAVADASLSAEIRKATASTLISMLAPSADSGANATI